MFMMLISCGFEDSKSPRKPRRRVNSTPKKQKTCVTPQKQQMNSANEDCSDKMLASPPKQIPDLRLEAKMSAEVGHKS